MSEIHDFLSRLVLSEGFREKFIGAMKSGTQEKSVTELLEKEGFSIRNDQIKNQILNLDISDLMAKKMKDVDDFLYSKTGLDPQW